jgi:hypothetical protein
MHLGVNVPGVDVHVNGGADPAFADINFRESTVYAALPADDYVFNIAIAGTGVDASVLDVGPLGLAADTDYTAVAVGNLNDGLETIDVLALVDDKAGIGDAIRVQVVHAASSVGQVDIWNVTDPNAPALLLEDVDFKSAGTLDLPVADYAIGIDVDNDMVPDLIYGAPLATLQLAAGAFLNVYASDDMNGEVALVAQLEDGTAIPIAAN